MLSGLSQKGMLLVIRAGLPLQNYNLTDLDCRKSQDPGNGSGFPKY